MRTSRLLEVVILGVTLAQGLGIGSGLDDIRRIGQAAAPPPSCAQNFVFQQNDITGCTAVVWVMMGY